MVTIKGDVKRKDEIIKWLEDLGGHNRWKMSGHDEKGSYYINDFGDICCSHSFNVYMSLTLDEFKTKYPFKLNEWVSEKNNPSHVLNINKVLFEYDRIVYEGKNERGDLIVFESDQLNQLESFPIKITNWDLYNTPLIDNKTPGVYTIKYSDDIEIDKIENNIIFFKKREP